MKMFRYDVLFSGYYGHQNSGDDSFIEVASWGAKKYWNLESKFITERMPVIKTPASFTGTGLFPYHNSLKVFQAINKTKILVFAGGSTFHSSLQKYEPKKLAVLYKKFRNIKLGAIGVSLGPYRSAKAEVDNIELLKRFDFLALRDHSSYQLALDYNLPYKPIQAFDLAALLPLIYKDRPTSRSDSRVIGISLCNYERYLPGGDLNNESRRNNRMFELLNQICTIDPSVKLRFFIFNGNSAVGDEQLTRKFVELLKNKGFQNIELIMYNSNVHETWLKIADCSLVISTRLHAAIFACFARIPFFLVEYHKKCAEFLESVGYDSSLRLYDAKFDNTVIDKIMNILHDGSLFGSPLNFNHSIEIAKLNFQSISL